MRAADIGTQRVAVWGLGREGRAAIRFLRQRHPSLPLLVLDDIWENDVIALALGPPASLLCTSRRRSLPWISPVRLDCNL